MGIPIPDQTSIAIIQNNISYIQKDVASMTAALKELSNVFATKDQLADTARQTEIRLKRLEEASNLWRWLSPTLSAAVSSVMTFLIVQYITHIK